MKKIILCLMMILMVVAGTVSAEKIKFKDPAFDFNGYHTIQLTEIKMVDVADEHYNADKTADSKLVTLLRSALSDKKMSLRLPEGTVNVTHEGKANETSVATVETTSDAMSKVTSAGTVKAAPETTDAGKAAVVVPSFNLTDKPALQVSVTVYELGYKKWHHDAWKETKTVMRDFKYYDSKGKESVVRLPMTETMDHPAGYNYQAEADIEFNVMNPKNGAVVYTVRDTRQRDGEASSDSMLKRIVKDFVSDIS